MATNSTLDRAPLRDRIHGVLRTRILRGEIAPGDPVRDTEVAASLGASRTPVREAMVRLAAEGLLQNRVGRGFRVPPLVRSELDEVQPLLARLEPLALELSAPCSRAQARRLDSLLRKLDDREASPEVRHERDADWHRGLIAGCGNPRLLRIVEELRGVLRRYEIAYLRGTAGMQQSLEEHAAIQAAFVNDERERAVALLREHWQRGEAELRQLISEETER